MACGDFFPLIAWKGQLWREFHFLPTFLLLPLTSSISRNRSGLPRNRGERSSERHTAPLFLQQQLKSTCITCLELGNNRFSDFRHIKYIHYNNLHWVLWHRLEVNKLITLPAVNLRTAKNSLLGLTRIKRPTKKKKRVKSK